MDEFEGAVAIKGLEHLGRHIRDSKGAVSGSPANFEKLRGLSDEPTEGLDPQDAEDKLVREFGVPKKAKGTDSN